MDGETTSTECPSAEDCYTPSSEEQAILDFVNLHREIRSAAAAIFWLQSSLEGPFYLERESRRSGNSFITLANREENVRVTFEIEHGANYPHSYGVTFKEGEEKVTYWV